MAEPPKQRNVLLYLAAEGVIPVIGGCAGALAGGPVGGIAGVAVGKAVEKAVNLFGRGIVERWREWFARHPEDAQAAVAELAALPAAEAQKQARSIFLELVADAPTPDLDLAVEFLSAIPRAVDRVLVPNPSGEGRSVPPSVALDDPRSLLQLLPEDVPPYPAAADLPGTPYRLVELVGAGGFGAVYRALSPTLQHLPLAIKFCLDRSLLPALNQERSNLERLMRAGGPGARHVVRLYGYDLDHPTPYLVYEYVEGGDLTRLVAERRARGAPPAPAEVLGWVLQIAEGLAFAHRTGLVHRDLKPANVLVCATNSGHRDVEASEPAGFELRLADFGLGGVAAARSAARSRIGTSTIDYLSLAEQASLFRGAGTPLYMSPEQRRGAPPDARHDLYALGVVWYQLLVGDVSRELHHGWAKELVARFGVPATHIGLIERCVGWYDERPRDAGELLAPLKDALANASMLPAREHRPPLAPDVPAPLRATDTALNASQITPGPRPIAPASEGRRRGVLASLTRLNTTHTELDALSDRGLGTTALYGALLVLGLGVPVCALIATTMRPYARIELFLVAVPGALLFWLGYVVFVRFGVRAVTRKARDRADALVEEIATDFPEDVASWGGRAALRHPPTVRQIQQELDPPPAPIPPKSTPGPEDIAADPTRRALLAARLREHAEWLKYIKDNTDMVWVGLVLLWMFAAPAVGALCSTIPYLWDRGGSAKELMTAIGVASGGLAAWAMWYPMAAVRRHLARVREDRIAGFAADYPKLVEAWGGRSVLESPASVAALLRSLDPAAAAGSPGFFRRLFGR